jgi:hypothetical protein
MLPSDCKRFLFVRSAQAVDRVPRRMSVVPPQITGLTVTAYRQQTQVHDT